MTRASAPCPRTRALTLLEVLLAVALLALVAASVLGAISAIDGMQARSKMLLAASEVGNRLMLQYLDNEKSLPPKSQPVAYGPYRFFYELTIEKVTMDLNERQRSLDSRPNDQGLNRFEQVSVTLFEARDADGQTVPVEQVAQISRVVDPFAMRNPETVQGYDRDHSRINDLIGKITGSAPK